jgi:hypothetical protein
MKADPIADLLQRADRAAGAPAGPSELADRVRRKARRRRSFRIAAGAVAAGVVVSAGAALWLGRFQPGQDRPIVQKPPSREELARLRDEIRRLRDQADSQAAIVRHMLALMQKQENGLEELRQQLARPDPAEQVQSQIDRAAFIILCQAERMSRQEALRPSAVEAYRRVLQLFPQSRWAVVARKKLSEIRPPEQGDTS